MPRRPAHLPDTLGEIRSVIGEDALFALAENFGGTRLYVPVRLTDSHEIVRAIGPVATEKLIARFAPDVIRVPLCREMRAIRHRALGMSNARIAVRLGMTETGLNKLFRRFADAGEVNLR